MLLLLSPAKTLDYTTPITNAAPSDYTVPRLFTRSLELLPTLRGLSPDDLMRMMDISEPLALLNRDRFAALSSTFDNHNSRPAIFAFRGDVYNGMNPELWSEPDHAYAQQHLRILSGLYGLLRPLDRIQPYRLEMKTRLANPRGRNLYEFWHGALTPLLVEDMQTTGEDIIVNLASEEYFHAIEPQLIGAGGGRVVQCSFKERRGGVLKIISFSAKKARGAMADFIIRHRHTHPEQLKAFTADGYAFAPELSTDDVLMFVR